MSTVILDTITGKSTATTITIGSTPVVSASANSMTIRGEGTAHTSIQQGLIKTWCTVDENSSHVVRDSFNNSSVTDNSTANTSFTATNAFSNTDFSFLCLPSLEGSSGSYDLCYEISASRTTSVARAESRNYASGSVYDDEYKSIQICGDLA